MDKLELTDSEKLEKQREIIKGIKTIPSGYTRKLILSGVVMMSTQIIGALTILKSNKAQVNMSTELESTIKKLISECNKRNIKVTKLDSFNSYAINKWYANAIKLVRPDLRKHLDEIIGDKEGSIFISEFTSPEIIAHEIGHADTGNFIERSWATIVGLVKGLSTLSPFMALLSILGILQGILKVRSKLLDKPDLAYINYMKHLTRLPIILTLLEEGRASVKGLILLKKCGVDSKNLITGTSTLLSAYGTYIGMALFKSIAMQSFEYLGVRLAKRYYSNHLVK